MRTFICLMAMLTASPALACNTDLIVAQENWTAVNQPLADGTITTTISLSYLYEGEKPSRMIDSIVVFRDALGGMMAVVRIDRDSKLQKGQISEITITSYGPSLPRLADIDRSDVAVSSCTKAIIYADGAIEEFEDGS